MVRQELLPEEGRVLVQLVSTRGIGPRALERILARTGQPKAGLTELGEIGAETFTDRFGVDFETAEEFLANNGRAEQIWEHLQERSVTILLRDRAGYPEGLLKGRGEVAPPVLFASGNLDLLQRRAVGFCGSRQASERGQAIAAECAATLGSRGFNIVSGHANGVDLAAHRGALEKGPGTTLVLAEGILQFRLKSELRDLADADRILAISQFPPRLPWSARNAMIRNHTICGLSHAMILIESGLEGGTFECGKAALQQRRPLFVVDYSHPPESAAGNAYFLGRGAVPLRSSRDGNANLDAVVEAASTERKPEFDFAGELFPFEN